MKVNHILKEINNSKPSNKETYFFFKLDKQKQVNSELNFN